MEAFYSWLSAVGAICVGIAVLAVFFSILGYLKRRGTGVVPLKLSKALNDGASVEILLNSGKTISGVRFVGLSEPDSTMGLPYAVAIFQRPDGRKVLIRADAIRMIEELGADSGDSDR